MRRSRAQAAQENADVDSPVLPSYSMPKALIRDRVASATVSSEPAGWNMPFEADRLARLDAERDDVLDLEVDRVADPDAVTDAVVARPRSETRSTPSISPTSGTSARHRPAELPAEDRRELVRLLVARRARR